MNILRKKETTDLLLLTLVSSILVVVWFRNGNLFIGAEEGAVFYNIENELNHAISTIWLEQFMGMPYFSELSKLPYYLVIHFLNKLGIDSFFLQSGTFLLILTGSSTGMYMLLKSILPGIYRSRLSILAGSLFYLANPFTISQVWMRGLYTQFFAYLYFPVFLMFFVLFLNTQKYVYLLCALIVSVLFAPAMGNPAYFISLWILVGTYLLFNLVFTGHPFMKRIKLLSISFLFFVSWIVINSWWMFPTVTYASSVYLSEGTVFDNSLESLLAVSSQHTFSGIIRLYHKLHFEIVAVYGGFYSNIFTQFLSFIPVLLLAGSFYYRKCKVFLYFMILLTLGLFVVMGSNPPFGKLFVYLFNHLSPLQVFRNPYEKFGLVYLIAYSGLFTMGFSALLYFLESKTKYLGKVFICTVFILHLGIHNWPFWAGTVIEWGTKVSIPNQYGNLNDYFLGKDSVTTRILFLPLLSDLGASYKWSGGEYHGNDPIFQIFSFPVITQTGKNLFLNSLKQYTGSMDLSGALALARVGNIVDRPDVNSTRRDKNHFSYFTKNYYQPDKNTSTLICNNLKPQNLKSRQVNCIPEPSVSDFSKIIFLHLEIKSHSPSYIEISIEDKDGIRSRWSGKNIKEYQLFPNVTTFQKEITIYLNNPIENADLDYSKISQIDIWVKTINPNDVESEFEVESIKADEGVYSSVQIDGTTETVQGRRIFSLNPEYIIPEMGFSNKVYIVENYKELFQEANRLYPDLSTTTFLIKDQNVNKNINVLETALFENHAVKVSETRYLYKSDSTNQNIIFLNKSFNPEWKVVNISDPGDLQPGFINNLKLLRKSNYEENIHLQSHGYANTWILPKNTEYYAVIYKPQIVLEIFITISKLLFITVLILFISIIIWIWKKKKSRFYVNLSSGNNKS